MSAAQKKVTDLIAQNAIMVFSKSYCPYCVRVKGLFQSLSVPFKALELDEVPDGDAIQSALASLSGQRTVPNVYIGGKHIGGCDSTTALHARGELVPLIQQATQ